jgi:DNA-binding HxlR family transcriptional regulator
MRQKRHKRYPLNSGCGVEACLEVIGGKWKGVILHHLLEGGVLRFGELKKLKPELSPRILTTQLRELEHDGVVLRKVFPVVPPKVEYSLSEFGKTLEPIIKMMQTWGDTYLLRADSSVHGGVRGRSPESHGIGKAKTLPLMNTDATD